MEYELIGQHYACDGVYLSKVIVRGSYETCEESLMHHQCLGVYLDMEIVEADDEDYEYYEDE